MKNRFWNPDSSMQLTISAYVTTEKREGTELYVCRPLTEMSPVVRDPMMRVALQRLANKTREAIHRWIETGRVDRVQSLLYDSERESRILKLTIVLRDRTLRWKLLMVVAPCWDGMIAFSPSLPDLKFDLTSLAELETRATEVYTKWCQERLNEDANFDLAAVGLQSDAWIEPVDLTTTVNERKRSKKNFLAALLGRNKMRGEDELRKVGRSLDELASEFSEAVNRQHIVAQLDRLLLRDDRQPIVLIGPSGVGKTAIIEDCIARRNQRVKERSRPGNKTWLISPQRLISGMSYLGQWEERWLSILKEATARDHILYFDDMLGLLSAGITRDSRLSTADVLKSYLSQNRVRILAEMTPESWAVLRRKDPGLADIFHPVQVPALDQNSTLAILDRIVANLEASQNHFFHPDVLPEILDKQSCFAPHRAFPGKAIEVAKNLSRSETPVIGVEDLNNYFQSTTGVARRMLGTVLGQDIPLDTSIDRALIGQPDASQAIKKIANRACQRLAPLDRPLGVLLFLGPTGVGKTEASKVLTQILYEDESHMLRFDMNEVTTPSAAEQLIGTFDQPDGRLTSAVRRKPFSVVLLDEIEKAHPDVFDYLLQVIGEGRLTDAHGRTVDFRNTVIIMTSNLGSRDDQSNMGFDARSSRNSLYRRAAEQFFRPEFFNRIDEVVVFRRLEIDDIRTIADQQMRRLFQRDGLQRREAYVRVEPDVMEWVVARGFDLELGARAIKRSIETQLAQPLADELSSFHHDNPLWIDLQMQSSMAAMDPSAVRFTTLQNSPFHCRVESLRRVAAQPAYVEMGLGEMVILGERRLQEFTDQLGQLSPESDRQTQDHARVRYYALHDQLFRFRDLLRTAKEWMKEQKSPNLRPLQSNPSAVRRPSNQRSTSGRRFMIEYQSEQDIEDVVSESRGPLSAHPRGETDLRIQLRRSMDLCQSMIEHAHAPMRWMLEMRFLTDSTDELAQYVMSDIDEVRPKELHSRAFQGGWSSAVEPAVSFIECLSNTLRVAFQYEVTRQATHPHAAIVAGIASPGILEPILGTYQSLNLFGESLACLIAYPIAADQKLEDVVRPSTDPWDDSTSIVDWRTIRGELRNGVLDLRSGTQLSFDDTIAQWSHWWLDLLHRSLQEKEGGKRS
jgi:ATP-dependent Clp protease ATP-binding subunit ClpA